MSYIKIPIKNLPIFHNYLYEYIKKEGEYNLSFDFIGDNISVVGYCNCKQNECASVSLDCKVSLNKYKSKNSENLYVVQEKDMEFFHIDFFHIDENGKPIEYEYIANTTHDNLLKCSAIYQNEIHQAVDNMIEIRSRIRKNKKLKNK